MGLENWVPGFVTGTLSLIAAIASGIITGILTSRRERRKDERDSARPGSPTVQQIWERQDRLERGFKASLVLLSEVAEQTDVKGLHLSKRALRTLADGEWLPDEFYELLEHSGPQAP